MNKATRIILLTLLGFGIHQLLRELLFADLFYAFRDATGLIVPMYWLVYFIVGIPIFITVLLLHPAGYFFSALGLSGSLPKALITSFLFALPMLLGYSLVFGLDGEFSAVKAGTGAAAAAFFEEVYYRAFLFGMIYRYTRLGFLPSIVFGALVFALAHLYQSEDLTTLIGIFLTTFLGAGLFAWMYVEWNYNLWVPIFLHFFMNLYWMLFAAGDNALGGGYSNIFRALTIACAIIGTIVYKRRRRQQLAIRRETMWMKPRVEQFLG
jgi:hypothetical protein